MKHIPFTIVFVAVFNILSAQSSDSASWRTVFVEPQLQALIDTALIHNADLRTASLNVVQSEAQLRAARLSLLPTISIGPETSLQRSLTIGQSSAANDFSYNVPVTMQWEVSLAGRFCGERRAAENTFWSAVEDERAVRLQVLTAVASHYYTLAALYAQLRITHQCVATAGRTVEVLEALKDAGMQNEAAVSQARVSWLETAATEKNIIQQIAASRNALSTILGATWGTLDSLMCDSLLVTDPPSDISYSLDSFKLSELSNRPDVKAAEYALASQVAEVTVARSAFYPSLSLSASLGWTNNIGQIVNPPQMLLNAIGSLLQPLFNQGRNRANLRIAKARQENALVRFHQTLLEACVELSDALTASRLSDERLLLRQQEVDAAQKAYDVSIALMQHGSQTYLEVLTAQATLLSSQLALVSDRLDRNIALINIYKASGGYAPDTEN